MPLNAKQVAAIVKAGGVMKPDRKTGVPRMHHKIPDGRGLYLVIKNGVGFWVSHWRDGNVIRSAGRGPAETVTPIQARNAHEAANAERRSGAVPRNRSQTVKGKTFAEVAAAYLEHNASVWSTASLARNRTLLRYAASLDKVPVNRITAQMVADVLRPIWSGPTNNRGAKLRSLIERILIGNVERNPATWDLLRHPDYQLALKAPETKSHAAMPANEVAHFVKRLDMGKVADRAILFTILTGVRRSEATGAAWGEFDLTNKRWLIPAARMKTGKDHFVPLTQSAIDCLGERRGADDALVFAGAQGHDALRLSKRFGVDYDLHGFRTSLASWAEEQGYRTNVIQAALAHRKRDDKGNALGSQDTAYMRATLFDDRRKLHDAWASFVMGDKEQK